MNCRIVAAYHREVVLVAMFFLVFAAPAQAQDGFLEKMTKAAKNISSTAAEYAMKDATSIDLESQNLSIVGMGPLNFGVSKVDIKETVGVRVHAYFYNPTDQAVSIPVPAPGTFVLVDEKGRRLQTVSEPKIDKLSKGASVLIVPALERVSIKILYGPPAADAEKAVLKAGQNGMIQGIPLRSTTGVAPAASDSTVQ